MQTFLTENQDYLPGVKLFKTFCRLDEIKFGYGQL